MGRGRNAFRSVRAALAALLWAGICAVPAVLLAAEPPKPCLALIAPPNGASIPPGKALVIGSAKGMGNLERVEVDVDGKGRQAVPVAAGGFVATVELGKGKNVVRVVAGKTSVSAVVIGEKGGSYRYHSDVERCEGCHAKGNGFALPGPKDAVCYRCHDRQDAGKLVHGPLGNGECTACHDPHGSGNPHLALADARMLCVTCHDQESSAGHLKRSAGKGCTECHAPHSSDKEYLQR